MVVVVAARVVAGSLVGDPVRFSGGACPSSKEGGRYGAVIFRNQNRLLCLFYSNSDTLATLPLSLHTRHQDNAHFPLKNNTPIVPFQHSPPLLVGLVWDVCTFFFLFLPVVSVLPPVQQSQCDIDLGYTFLIIGSVGESLPSAS